MPLRHADGRYGRRITFTIMCICWKYKIVNGQQSEAASKCWYLGPLFEPPYLGGEWFFHSICSQLLKGKDDILGSC